MKEFKDWDEIRKQFKLAKDVVHIGASQFIASNPKIVRKEIRKWRKALDADPVKCVGDNGDQMLTYTQEIIAAYMKADASEIALTQGTTSGLGLLYNGIDIREGQEVLTTKHDHYCHREALHLMSERKKASVREIQMYEDSFKATWQELVDSIINEIRDNTRIVAVTWVHSGTGLKIPVGEIGKEIRRINEQRDRDDRILYCVDGVHGFGIENDSMDDLNCDFFITSCHKWLYGPRGTGFICAARGMWSFVLPTIPDFSEVMKSEITEGKDRPEEMTSKQATPGGFIDYEHRWALPVAFRFHNKVGRKRIADRVHELNRYCKEQMLKMEHVELLTPLEDELSAGIISFNVNGYKSKEAVEHFMKKNIRVTEAPYLPPAVRFTPGIYNSYEDLDIALKELSEMRS